MSEDAGRHRVDGLEACCRPLDGEGMGCSCGGRGLARREARGFDVSAAERLDVEHSAQQFYHGLPGANARRAASGPDVR